MDRLTLLSRAENFGAKSYKRVPDLKNIPIQSKLPLQVRSLEGQELYIVSPFDYKTLYTDTNHIKVIKDKSWDNSSTIALRETDEVNRLLPLKESTHLILYGALEYSEDIRPLLTRARKILSAGGSVSLIGGYDTGYWCWGVEDITNLLAAFGIKVKMITQEDGVYYLETTCSKEDFNSFYSRNSLPEPTFRHLIITTEHSAYRVTGGIGSYVNECDMLYGDDVAILILDSNSTVDIEKIRKNKWLAAQIFLSEERITQIEHSNFDTIGDLSEEILQSILTLYPQIEYIESQEMLLNRAIEAKRSRLLSSNIKLITTCHGSSFHLAKAKRTVLDAENIHTAYREKFTIEESDSVIFPTHFLRESYRDSGVMELDDNSRIIKRLPFNTNRLPCGIELESYRRLVYIGKTSTIKGFDLFLETLIEIHKNHPKITSQIEEVIVMATSTHIQERHLQAMYRHVESIFNIRMVSLDREDLLTTLSDYSKDSLALVTYMGDNHPLAILELMGVGHDFIAANSAGSPELILVGHEKDHLVKPTPDAFARAIEKIFSVPSDRSELVKTVRKKYLLEQEAINQSYSIEGLKQLATKRPPINNKDKPTIAIEVVDTGDHQKLEMTLNSLRQQSVSDLRVDVRQEFDLSHGANIRLYAGDILYPYAIDLLLQKLNSDKNTGAVLAYELTLSYRGEKLKGVEEFHPYAPELGSVFLQEKYSRRIVGTYKDKNNNNLTDWQHAIKVACDMKTVRIVPRLVMELGEVEFYPSIDVLHNSRQFANSFSVLPVFDATILYAQLKRFDDIYWGIKLINHMDDLLIRRDQVDLDAQMSPELKKTVLIYRRFTPRVLRLVNRQIFKLVFRLARALKKSFGA